jgi:anti-sigma B factor antagonist
MRVGELSGVTIIAIDNRLDLNTGPELKRKIESLVGEGKTKVVIDLEDTKFIDSSGCGALVSTLRTLTANNGDLKIANPSDHAKHLFQSTRLYHIFQVFDDLESAIGSHW